jgi:hypothetical protein
MTTRDKDRDYEVGYRRPPKATRFKQGQSGNPKGRPKARKSVGTLLEENFYRKIPITENGKRREITMLEAILRQLVNGAVKGDMRSIDRVLKLLPHLQEAREDALSGADPASLTDPHADRAVLEALAEMFGSDPEQLFATIQGGIDDDCPEF